MDRLYNQLATDMGDTQNGNGKEKLALTNGGNGDDDAGQNEAQSAANAERQSLPPLPALPAPGDTTTDGTSSTAIVEAGKAGDADANSKASGKKNSKTNDPSQMQLQVRDDSALVEKIAYPKGNNGKALVLPDQATAEELQDSTTPEEA
eukprot:392751_1